MYETNEKNCSRTGLWNCDHLKAIERMKTSFEWVFQGAAHLIILQKGDAMHGQVIRDKHICDILNGPVINAPGAYLKNLNALTMTLTVYMPDHANVKSSQKQYGM